MDPETVYDLKSVKLPYLSGLALHGFVAAVDATVVARLCPLAEIIRFATPANLTGLPALSFPAGTTPQGLPVGMQGIGRAWDEVTLLRLARAADAVVPSQAPQVM